jgi:hypothetical protein
MTSPISEELAKLILNVAQTGFVSVAKEFAATCRLQPWP